MDMGNRKRKICISTIELKNIDDFYSVGIIHHDSKLSLVKVGSVFRTKRKQKSEVSPVKGNYFMVDHGSGGGSA